LIFAGMAVADFFAQFLIPLASKSMHFYGLATGVIMWMYFYGFKVPYPMNFIK